MRQVRYATVMAALLCVWLVPPAAALGQATPLHEKVTVAYHDLDVAEVLKDLGDRSGVRFACDDELLKGLDRVTYATTQQAVLLLKK